MAVNLRLTELFNFTAKGIKKNRRRGAKHKDFSAPPAAICVNGYDLGFIAYSFFNS